MVAWAQDKLPLELGLWDLAQLIHSEGGGGGCGCGPCNGCAAGRGILAKGGGIHAPQSELRNAPSYQPDHLFLSL